MEIQELGEVIRKVRKERGLRLEDLADENISPATISNIERGVSHVSSDKAMYLLKKLEISLDQIPGLLMREQEELNQIQFELLGAESLFSNGKADQAMELLSKYDLDDAHPLAAQVHYLKGKCLIQQKKWKRAERSLYKAIQLASQRGKQTNIEAASFNELAMICYFNNELDKALQFVDSGLDAFEIDGDRHYVLHVLQLNKAIFLEKLGRLNESMSAVNDSWKMIDVMDSKNVHTFYWLKSDLLRRSRQYNQAVKTALEGLDKSRRTEDFDLMFELWTVLGSIFLDQEQWKKAEFSFEQALALDRVSQRKFIITYAKLGELFIVQEKWDEAFDALTKSLSLAENFNDVSRLDKVLQTFGDYHRCRGEKKEAISFYERALDLATRYGFKKREYTSLFRLAQCWDGIDTEKFQKVTANLYRVQSELEKEGVQPFEES